MQPTKELGDAIYIDKVRRARSTPMSQKFLDVGLLFANACMWMEMGIRQERPGASDAEIRNLLIQRIERLRQLHETSWKRPHTSSK